MLRPATRERLLGVLWIALAAAGAAHAQPRAVVPGAVRDFGRVQKGDVLEHAFEIRNQGNEELVLSEVRPTCGCTVASYDSTIAPGGAGTVTASMKTERLRGPVAKSIRVFTNDPASPELNLVLKAAVRTPVEVDPGYARFMTVRGEPVEPVLQKVWPDRERDLVIESARSPFDHLQVEVRRATDDEKTSGKPGTQWVVELRLAAEAPEGPMADFVTLRTNHPERPEVKIPVSGFVRPVLAVIPRVVDFGPQEVGEGQQALLEVKNLGTPAVALGEVTTDLAGVAAEVEPIEEGRRYKVRLTLDPAMPKGDFQGKLRIETTSARQPWIEVDLRGTVL